MPVTRIPLIAEVYSLRTIDTVVQLAYAVSHDFVSRPRHYRDVPENIANVISDLRVLTGSHPDWPNAAQRAAISRSLLAGVCTAMVSLRRAAISFSKKGFDRGREMHRQAFLDEMVALRSSLKALEGQVLSIGYRQINAIFRKAAEVLGSEEVARVFGFPPAPAGDWPLGGVFSADAACLCEEIAKTFAGPQKTLSQEKLLTLQRVAHYGALTIAGVLDESAGWDKKDRIDALSETTYSWTKGLQNLLSNIDITRAWKDPEYRRSLEIAERDILPAHPAGEIELKDTDLDPSVAARRISGEVTYTIDIEICCCSGEACYTDPFTVCCVVID